MSLPSEQPIKTRMTDADASSVSMKAAQVFSPRTPVHTRALFAGRRWQVNSVLDAVSQLGLHMVIYGERGVGKSSLANIIKPLLEAAVPNIPFLVMRINANNQDSFASLWARAFDEVRIEDEKPVFGFSGSVRKDSVPLRVAFGLDEKLTIDDVRRALGYLPHSVVVIDEFDRITRKEAAQFTDLIKVLSDMAVPTTLVLVGVADTVNDLVRDHQSVVRAVVQVNMPRMSIAELREILVKAAEALGMTFEDQASSRITRMSQGLPHYTHLVGLHAVRSACERRSWSVTLPDVEKGFSFAVKQADQSIAEHYITATHSAHSSTLFAPVLLACAIAACRAPDQAMGYFQAADVVQPLEAILGRSIQFATFTGHLTEFASDVRGKILIRTGRSRAYRYRFRDPLAPPFVLMRGVADGVVSADAIEHLLEHSPSSGQEAD